MVMFLSFFFFFGYKVAIQCVKFVLGVKICLLMRTI